MAAVRPRKRGPGAEQNRALRMLAGSPRGCTEAIMLAHGFTVEILGRLVLRLATAMPGTTHTGGRPIAVIWADDHRYRATGARRRVAAAGRR
jgi:hypothetical protein